MADKEQLQDSDFLREKIKERPINRKKLLKQTLITGLLAITFAFIASITFIFLAPFISSKITPVETPVKVEFPEEVDLRDEISPEDMLSEEVVPTPTTENEELVEEQIEEIIAGMEWSFDDYRRLSDTMGDFVADKQRCVVTVRGAVSNTDWFNETYESVGATSGFIFFDNGIDTLILVDRENIDGAESIKVSFFDGTVVEGYEKMYDVETGLSVVGVSNSEIPSSVKEQLLVAPLGSSNPSKGLKGTSIIALGSPDGHENSVSLGRITSDTGVINKSDANYKLIATDIYGSSYASGIIMNLNGEVLGVISMKDNAQDMSNNICALGISELKKVISRMGNGQELLYLGIVGTDVTDEVHETLNLPYGAYIKEIYMDTPAMRAGVQRGDVIVSINGKMVDRFINYTNILMGLEAEEKVELVVMRQSQNDFKEMTFSIELAGNR